MAAKFKVGDRVRLTHIAQLRYRVVNGNRICKITRVGIESLTDDVEAFTVAVDDSEINRIMLVDRDFEAAPSAAFTDEQLRYMAANGTGTVTEEEAWLVKRVVELMDRRQAGFHLTAARAEKIVYEAVIDLIWIQETDARALRTAWDSLSAQTKAELATVMIERVEKILKEG